MRKEEKRKLFYNHFTYSKFIHSIYRLSAVQGAENTLGSKPMKMPILVDLTIFS
jgi:hypothetical protein